jgi:hypothetical protein
VLWLSFIGFITVFLSTAFIQIRDGERLFALFAAALLGFLAGGRLDYGVDYEEYRIIFDSVPFLWTFFDQGALLDIHGEYVFLFLSTAFKSIGLGFEAFALFFAFLTVSTNIYAFRKFALPLSVFVLLYFSHNFLLKEMGQIRHGLSSAILLLSFYYLTRKRIGLYVLFTLIASLFHAAALIFICASLAIRTRFSLLFVFVALSFIIGSTGWLNASINLFGSYLPSRVVEYVGSEYHQNIGLNNPQTIKQLFFSIIFYIMYLDISKRKLSISPITVNLLAGSLKVYILSVVFLNTLVEFDLIARRLASYFSIVEPLIFACVLQIYHKHGIQSKYWPLMGFVSIYAGVSFYINTTFRENFNGHYLNWIVSGLIW